jgi:hypothetical protein
LLGSHLLKFLTIHMHLLCPIRVELLGLWVTLDDQRGTKSINIQLFVPEIDIEYWLVVYLPL